MPDRPTAFWNPFARKTVFFPFALEKVENMPKMRGFMNVLIRHEIVLKDKTIGLLKVKMGKMFCFL